MADNENVQKTNHQPVDSEMGPGSKALLQAPMQGARESKVCACVPRPMGAVASTGMCRAIDDMVATLGNEEANASAIE